MKTKASNIISNRTSIRNSVRDDIFARLDESGADVDEFDYFHGRLKEYDYCILCDSFVEENQIKNNVCDKCYKEYLGR